MGSTSRSTMGGMVKRALAGEDAHVTTGRVFDGLEWRFAGIRPGPSPHSVFELASHMVFWQQWGLAWLDGRSPAAPEHAAGGWPSSPTPGSRREWLEVVRHFQAGLKELTQRVDDTAMAQRRRGKSAVEMIATIAMHNSYHAGQVALLRQLLGHWPPPTGGLTW